MSSIETEAAFRTYPFLRHLFKEQFVSEVEVEEVEEDLFDGSPGEYQHDQIFLLGKSGELLLEVGVQQRTVPYSVWKPWTWRRYVKIEMRPSSKHYKGWVKKLMKRPMW
jgi:hypothetical protein